MIILHIIIDLTTGGAELMLARLVTSHQGSSEYRHKVVSLRGLGTVGPKIQDLGVQVDTLGAYSLLDFPAALLRLYRLIKAERPDIVQTWMYHADLLGGAAARLAGVRYILWGVRISDISRAMGISRMTSLVRRACAILSHFIPTRIVYVAETARITHEAIGYSQAKSIVIPNGYAINHEAGGFDRDFLRKELGLARDAIIIGSAGRYSAQKDHASFISATARIAAREPRARFVMMGREVEQGNRALALNVQDSGYSDRFFLLGERSDLLRCLAALDIFCLHSIGEGFPNVVAEAMSVGTPCVVTDVGDAAYLIEDTGLVVPPSDAEAMAEALARLIDGGPAVRARLGGAGRTRIMANFSVGAIRVRYESLYRGLVSH